MVYVLTVPKEVFRPGEPIPLTLKFDNRSGRPVTIWSSGFWPNHRVVVMDERGEEAPLTDIGKERRDLFAPGGARDKNAPRVLSAGETYREGLDLDVTRLYRLGPGRYHVQVTYHDIQGPTPLRVTSNAAAFEIKE
ncbi:MAG: hypothetical protein IRY99_19170 [Isosphaeraceae bacterium]|nr:hypothetical protein [Isosphaeraceae bacterium]